MNQERNPGKTGYNTSKPRTWKTELRNTIAFYEKLLQRNSGRYTSLNKTGAENRTHTEKEKSVIKERTGHPGEVRNTKEQDMGERSFSVELTREELEALQGILRDVQRDEMHEVTYTSPSFDFFDFDAEFDPEMLWEDTDLDEYREFLSEDVIEKLKAIQKLQREASKDGVMVSTDDFEEIHFLSDDDYEEEIQVSDGDYEEPMQILEADYEEEPHISEEDYDEEMEVTDRKYINLNISEEDYDDEIRISEEDYQE